jgi:hypothetical protein
MRVRCRIHPRNPHPKNPHPRRPCALLGVPGRNVQERQRTASVRGVPRQHALACRLLGARAVLVRPGIRALGAPGMRRLRRERLLSGARSEAGLSGAQYLARGLSGCLRLRVPPWILQLRQPVPGMRRGLLLCRGCPETVSAAQHFRAPELVRGQLHVCCWFRVNIYDFII